MLAHAYEYVCALADHQNMSKAAAHLCITQPALTKYINRLETELGMKLFNRNSMPITLTPAGRIFVEKARAILALENDLTQQLELVTSAPHGNLSIGLTPEFSSFVLPYILPYFKKLYPNINLTFLEGHNQYLFEELDRGRLDIALTSAPPSSPNVLAQPFLQDTILLAIPREHPIAQSFDLSVNSPLRPYYLEPSDVKNEDFVICSKGLGMGDIARSYFKKYNLNPNIVLELTRHENALRMASTGLGMIFTPCTTPLRTNLIKAMAYFSLEDPLHHRERCICHSQYAHNSKPVQYFIPVLMKVLQEEPSLKAPVCQLIYAPKSLA